MFNIKTKKDFSDIIVVDDIEAVFKQLLNNGNTFNEDVYVNIMKNIDNITFKEDRVIKTKFGTTTLDSLSTGCKTAILAVYYHDKPVYIRVDECGENVIKYLYQLSMNNIMNIYATIPISGYDDIECIIEGKRYNDSYDIYRKLVELNGYD